MKHLSALIGCAVLGIAALAAGGSSAGDLDEVLARSQILLAQAKADEPATSAKVPTKTVRSVWSPKLGRFVHFSHRRTTMRGHPTRSVTLKAVPTTKLPVDCTGDGTVSCPMDGNDAYGDCGPVMCAHVDSILTFGRGHWKQSQFNTQALVSQYLRISGGDNGTDEDMLVGGAGIWRSGSPNGPLAGASGAWPSTAPNASPVVLDALDLDLSNAPLTQYLIDQFYTVQVAWSVPDAFIQEFSTGASFMQAMTPNPENGHYTPITDVDPKGNYRLYTWGGWCWVSHAFLQSVQPASFVVFSTRQFDPATGYDSHGRHITTQAAAWAAAGGNTIAPSVISAFPPPSSPTPAPPTPPTPPTPPPPAPPTPPTPTPPATHGSVTLPAATPAGVFIMVPQTDLQTLQQSVQSLQQRIGAILSTK